MPIWFSKNSADKTTSPISFWSSFGFLFSFSLLCVISSRVSGYVSAAQNIKRNRKKSAKKTCIKIIFLFKLANKILSLYFLVLALWFYLILYVLHCPKSIDCTERRYQFVIRKKLSNIFRFCNYFVICFNHYRANSLIYLF